MSLQKLTLLFLLTFLGKSIAAQNCIGFNASIFHQQIKIANETLEHEEIAKLYYCFAQNFENKAAQDSAFHYYAKALKQSVAVNDIKSALQIYEKMEALSKKINLSQWKGVLAYSKGYLHSHLGIKQNIEVAIEQLEIAQKTFHADKDTLNLINTHLALGRLYYMDFDTETAESYFREAKKVFQQYSLKTPFKTLEIDYWLTANQVYQFMFNNNLLKKEPLKILKQFNQILSAYNKTNLPQDYYFKALIQNDIGLYYSILRKVDSISAIPLNTQKTHQDWQISLLDSSAYHYKKAIILWEKKFKNPHWELANTLNNLGSTYTNRCWHARDKKNYKIASHYYQLAKNSYDEALKIRKQAQGLFHPDIVRNMRNIAALSEAVDNYELALQQYHQAIQTSVNNFTNNNPFKLPSSFEANSSNAQLMTTILRKANLLHKWFKNSGKIDLLNKSLNHYLVSIDLLEKMVINYRSKESILKIIQKNWWIYESSIEIAFLLHSITQEEIYKEKAFKITEKSKSILTKASLQHKKAIELGISDTIFVIKDDSFSKRIVQLENKLILERLSNNEKNIQRIEGELFNTKQKHKKLLKEIEKTFPKYIKLKYTRNNTSIGAIRKTMLNHQAIIEYFVEDELIYAFCLTKDSLHTKTIKKDSSFKKQFNQFLAAINKFDKLEKWDSIFYQFTKSSHYLYLKLVEPLLEKASKNISELIIIPDNKLHTIAFEALISKLPPEKSEVDYTKLAYLMLEKNIRYAYSADLIGTAAQANSFSKKKKTTNFIGYACTYPKDSLKGQLPNGANSIEYAKKVLGGQAYINEQLDRKMIISPSPTPKIMALSLHTQVSDSIFPSYINFDLGKDSLTLNNLDFYQANYQGVELVVLSACQTIKGSFEKGEGFMNLARPIKYAGCNSTILSLWNLNDYSTASITKDFYNHLKAGLGKATALNQAKRNFIKQVGNQSHFSHPYFWAGLVLVGDNTPILFDEEYKTNKGLIIFGVGLFVLICSLVIYLMKL